MSIDYKNLNKTQKEGRARLDQNKYGVLGMLENYFDIDTLYCLEEKIINHLLDSMGLEKHGIMTTAKNHFNDYSFLTAPAYKALEGFLFQIAEDLNLPSAGDSKKIGSYYFNERKIDEHIDNLIKELEKRAESTTKLSKYEKRDIKDRIKEMDGFLRNYRHAPAHFFGEPIDTLEKAKINISTIFGTINNTTKILLKSKLINIKELDFQILEAKYGKSKTIDVTQQLNNLIKDNRLAVTVSNEIAGDPEPGIVKELKIKYIANGKTLEKEYKEGEEVNLP